MAQRHLRSPLERASDEVRSWLGDPNAVWRRHMDERDRREHPTIPWDQEDVRNAGETILGRADWGDRESDYAHGFGAMRGEEMSQSPDYSGRGPRGYRRSDERIHDDVCDRLTEDSRIDAFDIEVRVQNGEVTLSGNVKSRDEKRRAEDVAAAVRGVNDVTNELRLAPL